MDILFESICDNNVDHKEFKYWLKSQLKNLTINPVVFDTVVKTYLVLNDYALFYNDKPVYYIPDAINKRHLSIGKCDTSKYYPELTSLLKK